LNALILDCDGVIAETERDLHLPAFNQAFADFDLSIHWSEGDYKDCLRVAGGRERIAASLPTGSGDRRAGSYGQAGSDLAAQIHARKLEIFDDLLQRASLEARPGIKRLVSAAQAAGWRTAVASSSAEASVRKVVARVLGDGLAAKTVIFAGDAVSLKKPDPSIYLLALRELEVERSHTIVVEDAANGLRAALDAGLVCIVTPSNYTQHENFQDAAVVVSSLGEPGAPMTVFSNRTRARLLTCITLDDLTRILASEHGNLA
jgi:HAD superfamily hydrolase (TIGR01509 family)